MEQIRALELGLLPPWQVRYNSSIVSGCTFTLTDLQVAPEILAQLAGRGRQTYIQDLSNPLLD